MGLFDGIGDRLADVGNAVLPGSPFDRDEKKKPKVVPPWLRATGGHATNIHAISRGKGHGRGTAGEVYPQKSKALPPAIQKRVNQIWDEQFGGPRPYFRMANKPLKGILAYQVVARNGQPVIVFDPQQARDLQRVPNDMSGQYALATALHEMAHVGQLGGTAPASRWEPGAEIFSQLEYPGIQQDLDRYSPNAEQRKQMWQYRSYAPQTNAMIRRYYGNGYKGAYLPPSEWANQTRDLNNLTRYLRQEQFGYGDEGGAPAGVRQYSSNLPGRNPYQASAPKTPWDKLKWYPSY